MPNQATISGLPAANVANGEKTLSEIVENTKKEESETIFYKREIKMKPSRLHNETTSVVDCTR